MARGIAAISSEQSVLETSTDGGVTWKAIPGIVDFVVSGSEVTTRDVVPLDNAVGKRAGRPRVGSITCQAYYLPQSATWLALRTAKINRTIMQFRFSTDADSFYSGGTGPNTNTAAIGTNGAVTLTKGSAGPALPNFNDEAFGIGMAFRIDGSLYAVGDFNISGQAVVDPAPASAVSANAFSIEYPAMRLGPFAAYVLNTDEWNLASESELQTSLMLQPLATLPAAVMMV